jgi:hypothetical protein
MDVKEPSGYLRRMLLESGRWRNPRRERLRHIGMGTSKRTIVGENQPAALAAAGAIAHDMPADTAANIATQQLHTDAGCHNNPLCKESGPLEIQANPKP